MPFDTFAPHPGIRRKPDPFGRLLADPGPDPDIFGFKDPFRIRDSVGMEGMNSHRDVAKVENLLGRAGALDLAKTNGVTGFFGARTDEAVRKFQKDRGLKVDGLIHPEGPTLKTLIAQTGEQDPAKILPTLPRPFNPTPEPRREAVRRAASRLLQLKKAGIDPRAQLLQRQLAQANAGGGTPAPGAATPEKPSSPAQGSSPGKNPQIPAYRKEVFQSQRGVWKNYHKSVGALPGITATEKIVLPQIFAAEGGLWDDPDSTASSGILQETLDRAKKSGKVPGIENARRPADLTIPQRAAVAKFYFDDTLRTVGGGRALHTIGDAKAAGAFADTLFRHG